MEYGWAREDACRGYCPQRQSRQECEMQKDSFISLPPKPEAHILLGLITLGRCRGSGWGQRWTKQDIPHPTTRSMLLSWEVDKSMKWLQQGRGHRGREDFRGRATQIPHSPCYTQDTQPTSHLSHAMHVCMHMHVCV